MTGRDDENRLWIVKVRCLYIRVCGRDSMVEHVLFETEQHMDRTAVADYLRTVADKLDSGESVSLESGGESVTLNVPQSVEFEVKAEREGPADGHGELGLELELEWDEDSTDDSLSIS